MALSKKQIKRLTQLRAAQSLLQRAHDHIEVIGFNIDSYGDRGGKPACYVGAVRVSAGLAGHEFGDRMDEGDGPELTLALETLDKVAAPWLSEARKTDIELGHGDDSIGRIVEGYGFQLQDHGLSKDEQRNEALVMFRRALSEVYHKVEDLEAKGV